LESDLYQRAAFHPFIENGLWPRTVRTAATVELLDESGKSPPTLRRIDDDGGRRGQVSDNGVLEVEGEL
jgi:hypothetical protein